MNCRIRGTPKLQQFASMLQLMQKIGPEVCLELKNEEFVVTCLGVGQSSFVECKLHRSFFASYQIAMQGPYSFEIQEVKFLLAIFKGLKTVEQCELSIDRKQNDSFVLMVKFICTNEVEKQSVLDIHPKQAVRPNFNFPFFCHLKADSSVMKQILETMHNSPEVNFSIEGTNQLHVRTMDEEEGVGISSSCTIDLNTIQDFRFNHEAIQRSKKRLPLSDHQEKVAREYHKIHKKSQHYSQEDSQQEFLAPRDSCIGASFDIQTTRAFIAYCEKNHYPVIIQIHECGAPIAFKSNNEEFGGDIEILLLVAGTRGDKDDSDADEQSTRAKSVGTSSKTSIQQFSSQATKHHNPSDNDSGISESDDDDDRGKRRKL